MSKLNRRDFLRSGVAAASIAAGVPAVWSAEPSQKKRAATDWVALGKSGVKVTRLGLGTGTNGGEVQRNLGQKEFTRLVRHAYERGVRFFDTADNYDQMHEMLVKALEGIDRDTYTIQTKMKWGNNRDPWTEIDRFRKELKTDYFDSFLLHCVSTDDWPDALKRQMDTLCEAKDKDAVRSMGASVHGTRGLDAMTKTTWPDVALLRVNHNGAHMDTVENKWGLVGDVEQCVTDIRKIHDNGTGVIGMKLIANGDFKDPAQREAAIKYVMQLDCVDAVVIGFKTTAEIDEAIENMNKYLSA